MRRELMSKLQSPHWMLEEAMSGADALEKLELMKSELLLLDPTLPDLQAAEFQGLVHSQFPGVQVLTVNPHTGLPFASPSGCTAATAKLLEVLDGFGPLQTTTIPVACENDGRQYVDQSLPGLIGTSEAMQRVYGIARLVAPRDTTVLIAGHSGTGKDLIASAVHKLSARSSNSFVVINCAAIPEALLEAELFGYVKGAFTGAVQSRIGRIHAAQGGTLFLDEIGEMPLGLQSKLLRFLEQKEVQRLGSSDTFQVDVRVIAATNVNLRKQVQERNFREDLYYRLSVFPIELPALRDRMSDLLPLAEHFLAKFGLRRVSLGPDAISLLQQHTWPGNVRELRNVIERASILVGAGREISSQHIVI
jgi:transcriptional regulator with GAF, ATPase, and Fis domain